MKIIIGKNSKVQVAGTLAAAKALTAITKAANPSVSCTGHGYSVGDWVQFAFPSGMTRMDGQVARVKTVTDANTFVIEGVDTSLTPYVAHSGTEATVSKITAWVDFDNVRMIDLPESPPDRPDISTVHGMRKQTMIGLDGELAGTMTVLTNPNQAAVQLVRQAQIQQAMMPALVTTPNSVIGFAAEWAGGRGFSLDSGKPSESSINFTVVGEVAYL